MAFTTISGTQASFLQDYLRGTDRTLTEAQARANYGIKNLRARMTDLRNAGLRVSTVKTPSGKTAYKIAARDVNGSRARVKV